jgi:hypothetical protein
MTIVIDNEVFLRALIISWIKKLGENVLTDVNCVNDLLGVDEQCTAFIRFKDGNPGQYELKQIFEKKNIKVILICDKIEREDIPVDINLRYSGIEALPMTEDKVLKYYKSKRGDKDGKKTEQNWNNNSNSDNSGSNRDSDSRSRISNE